MKKWPLPSTSSVLVQGLLCMLSLGCGSATPAPDAGPATVLSGAVTVTVKATSQDGEAIDRASGTRTVRIDVSVANLGYPEALGVDPGDFFVVTDGKLEVTPSGCGPAVRVGQGGQFECRLTATMPWTNQATELVYAPKQPEAGGQSVRLPLTVAACTECGSLCRADRHACPPSVLELGAAGVASFAYSATHVYWADFSTGGVMGQKLEAAAGEQPVLLAQGNRGGPIAVSQDSVFFVTDHLSPATTLKKAPLAGGAPADVFDVSAIVGLEAITSVAVNGGNLFFVAFDGSSSTAWQVPLAGGSANRFIELEGPQDTFVIDGTHAYWVTGAGELKRAPLAGGPATVLVAENVDSVPPAINATHVFYVAYDLASRRSLISAVPLAGGTSRVLTDAAGLVNGLVADAQHLYWAVYGAAGRIQKVALAGDEPALLVGGVPMPNPGMLSLVGGRLYWAVSANQVGPPMPPLPRFIPALSRTF